MKALLERTGFIRAAPGDPPRRKDISELDEREDQSRRDLVYGDRVSFGRGRYHLMGAYKRHMLAAAESQPWDDTEHLRDQLIMEADAYEEAQLLVQGVRTRLELRFAIATWHRLAGLANKAEAQGSSAQVRSTIAKAIGVCEEQIVRLGGEVPTL
jgi:hypothetical protein